MPWELKNSVIANAPRQTVWEFVSDIDNLARIEGDAIESMTLDGPFQTGTRGTTKMRGQEPTHWRLVEVEPPERATYWLRRREQEETDREVIQTIEDELTRIQAIRIEL